MNVSSVNGHQISAMTLGTVQLGLPYGVNNKRGMPSYGEAENILRTALKYGICSFDTARAYGKSEDVLGKFFSGTDAQKTIITKVLFNDESIDEVRDSLFMQVKDSIKRLGVSHLPFLMLHREEYVDRYGNHLMMALKELKNEGLVSGIGISFSDKSNMDRILYNNDFDCIQIPQNIFDNKELITGKLAELKNMGIAVFIRSVYLQGLFFRDTNDLPPKLSVAKSALEKLHVIADKNGISTSQLALSYIRDGEGITSLVLGCEAVEQLKDSVKQFSCPPLDKGIRDELNEIAASVDKIVLRPWEWNG